MAPRLGSPSSVCLLVGKHRISVHSSVLVAESRFFKKMLGDLLITEKGLDADNQLEIPLRESVGKDAVEKLVSYAEGKRAIETVEDAEALLHLADMFDMPRLMEACEARLCLFVECTSQVVHRNDLTHVASLLRLADRLDLRHLHQRCKALVGFRLAQLTASCDTHALSQAVRVIADAGVSVACALESCLSVMWCLSSPKAQELSCPVCQAYQGWCRRCGNSCVNVRSNGRIPSMEKVLHVLKSLDKRLDKE